MKQDDYDLLSQFIDGELGQAENIEVKRRLLAEPEFNGLYQQLKSLSDSVSAVIPDFKDEPISDELAKLLDVKVDSQQSWFPSDWRKALPLAASVAFVAVLGYLLVSQPFQGNGLAIKESMLSHVADDENWLSENGTEVVVVQSYLDKAQNICREYYARESENVEHGLSCYDDGRWHKHVFAIKGNDSDKYYVTASSEYDGVEQFIADKALQPLTENQAVKALQALN